MISYNILNILSVFIALALFLFVFVFPGYIVGWLSDLFDFSKRRWIVKLGIGCLLSFVVSPILLFLVSFFLSMTVAVFILAICFILFLIINIRARNVISIDTYSRGIFNAGVIWIFIAILTLIGIQWGNELFLSVISFDQTTRVSVIDSITRTGVPPVNPGYFPGHPVLLTYLYYFWYILCSLVDGMAGTSASAFSSLIASSAWSGLGLITLVAFYIRERNAQFGRAAWNSAKIGVGLLAVSGLDVIPILFLILSMKTVVGSIDVWNTWIQSWAASNLWAPHHVSALIAGSVSILLAHSARGKVRSQQLIIFIFAGLGFASAFGLSLYVTFVFGLFWVIWWIVLYTQKTDRGLLAGMVLAGVVALIAVLPFLLGLFQSNSVGNSLPIKFEIRAFLQVEDFVKGWPAYARNLMMLVFLPINYMMELGYFSLVGLYWFKLRERKIYFSNPYFLAEILLLSTVLFIGSCLRSTVIDSNDLGWRAWLPGQFVLLIWGVDLFERYISPSKFTMNAQSLQIKKILLAYIVIGVLTTVVDLGLLRTAWPILTGEETSRRYYFGRLAYEYLEEETPEDTVVQNRPFSLLNLERSSGLYGSRQMIISDRALYGVPTDEIERLNDEISPLFLDENKLTWQAADDICRKHSIDILIFNDSDPVWSKVLELLIQRTPVYTNERYALFPCGN